MKITSRVGSLSEIETPLLVIPWCQESGVEEEVAEPLPENLGDLDAALGGTLGRALTAGDFRAKKRQSLLLYRMGTQGPQRVLLIGVGPRAALVAERLREAGGQAAGRAREVAVAELCVAAPDAAGGARGAREAGGAGGDGSLTLEAAVRALVEGLVLGAWRFDEFRSSPESPDSPALEKVEILMADRAGQGVVSAAVQVGEVLGRAQNFARELAVRPGNVATPAYLAEQAQALGKDLDLEVTVLTPHAMREEGMGALLAVAAGSDEEPRFIVMEYKGGGKEAPLVLVGKGVTFDSGGLSLKPPAGMESMKYDMSGAAAVIGAMKAIAELGPKVNVVGLVPSVENLPSAHSMRPGDIIRAHSGTTIEVLNTDAEGRLILADALSYAARYEPKAMVDAATLTGAAVIALGHHAIVLMGTEPDLLEQLQEAGERSGERVWQLPLWEEYREQLKSDIADIKNTGGRPAGTITAGMFLREFVGSIPWAHLDIAGTAWANEAGPYQPKGPTGVGVRLFTEWVIGRAS
ncbi:MAG: leucyl aminopeptidase [Gemmatimonadota bacterium]